MTQATVTPLTDEQLAAIEARERIATPGPWAWRGNIDNGDPRLMSLSSRYDVFGVIRHEITRAEALRRGVGDADYLDVKVSAEPEDTYEERWEAALEEAREEAIREYLTDHVTGDTAMENRLAFVRDHFYVEASRLVVFEVAPEVRDREDPRVYRADVVDIDNPDAQFIKHSREDVSLLLAEVRRLRTRVAELENTGGEPR